MTLLADDIPASPPPAAAGGASASPPPSQARRQFEKLTTHRQTLQSQRDRKSTRVDELNEFLALVPAIDDAMEKLGAELFRKLADLLQANLTTILQDVLQQPIKVVATQDHKRGAATLRLHIERDGQEEDI